MNYVSKTVNNLNTLNGNINVLYILQNVQPGINTNFNSSINDI